MRINILNYYTKSNINFNNYYQFKVIFYLICIFFSHINYEYYFIMIQDNPTGYSVYLSTLNSLYKHKIRNITKIIITDNLIILIYLFKFYLITYIFMFFILINIHLYRYFSIHYQLVVILI